MPDSTLSDDHLVCNFGDDVFGNADHVVYAAAVLIVDKGIVAVAKCVADMENVRLFEQFSLQQILDQRTLFVEKMIRAKNQA